MIVLDRDSCLNDICSLLLLLIGLAHEQELIYPNKEFIAVTNHTSPNVQNGITENQNNEITSSEAYISSYFDNSTDTLGYHIFSLAGETIKECDWRMLCVDRCSIKLNNMSETSPGVSSDVFSSFSTTSSPRMTIFRKKRQTYDQQFLGHVDNTASKIYLSEIIDSFHNSENWDTNNDSDFHGFRSRRNVDIEGSMCMPHDPKKDPFCYCDVDCFAYGDCCADVFESCLGLVEPDDISSFLSQHVESFNNVSTTDDLRQALKDQELDTDLIVSRYLSEYGTCIELNQITGVGTMIIHTCPHDFTDEDLQKKCQEPESPLLPPVTANVNGNFLPFKNIFCAQCHNIVDSIIPWKHNLACTQDLNTDGNKRLTIGAITDLVGEGVCTVTFEPPTDGMCSLRHCYQKFVMTDEEQQVLEKNEKIGMCTSLEALLCRAYFRPMSKEGRKNLHCKTCLEYVRKKHNVLSTSNVGSAWDCITDVVGIQKDNVYSGGVLIILDITGSYTYYKDKQKVKQYICADDEVLDPFTKECRRLVCQRSFEPFRGQCIKATDAYIVDGSTQIFPNTWDMMYLHFPIGEFMSTCNTACSNLSPLFPEIVRNTPDIQISKVLVFTRKRGHQCTNIGNDFTNSVFDNEIVCQEYIIDMEVEVKERFEIHLNILGSLGRDTIDQLYTMAEKNLAIFGSEDGHAIFVLTNMAVMNATDDICPQGLITKRKTSFSVIEYKGVLYAVRKSSDIEMSYPLQSVGYEIEISINKSLTTMKETIIVCDESEFFSKKNCTKIAYCLNETVQNGTQIFILKTEIMYEPGDYEIIGDQVFVCTNFTSPLTKRFEKDTVYLVISWVFTILSIIFLLIMLIIYAMFPELCNLPGKLKASLAATMMLTFVANLFTLVDLHNDYICPVAAALSHLVTLAHYGWMAAIAVNMAMTFGFRSMIKTSSLNENKTFLRYNVVVWGLSAAIVLTSVMLDMTHNETSNSTSGHANNTEDSQTSAPSCEVSRKSEDASGFPRYGYPYCTWFSGDMWTRLAFLIVPFFITYITSVTGFVITLVGIQRASKATAKIGKQSSDKTRCLIYFKLSTAMGFSWILSLVLVAEVPVLQYCYVILVLLQGVLLFLAFMVNKRVYSLIYKKFAWNKDRSFNTVTRTGGIMSHTL